MKHHLVIPTKMLAVFYRVLNFCKSIGDLVVRFWIAKIFIQSAMSKINDWDATIVLFKYVYTVPLLSPSVAAYLGTFAEFFLPIMLVLGLGGRLFIFMFFVYNVVCMISFNFLWTPAGASGLADHVNWGLLIMMVMLHGSGKISLDYLIHKRWGHLIRSGKYLHVE
jgi:putative oxidoreductase